MRTLLSLFFALLFIVSAAYAGYYDNEVYYSGSSYYEFDIEQTTVQINYGTGAYADVWTLAKARGRAEAWASVDEVNHPHWGIDIDSYKHAYSGSGWLVEEQSEYGWAKDLEVDMAAGTSCVNSCGYGSSLAAVEISW